MTQSIVFNKLALAIMLMLGYSVQASQKVLSSPAHLEEVPTHQEAFAWQNDQHFQATLKKFSALAETEYSAIIDRTLSEIKKSKDFFTESHAVLIEKLQETIFNWMNEDVLNGASTSDESVNEEQMLSDSPSDEDPWRVSFIRGFEQSDEDDSSDESIDGTQSEEQSHDEEDEQAEHEHRQLQRINKVLSLNLPSLTEFTKESIDLPAITLFLKYSVQNGYSWLLNEIIQGTFAPHEEFAESVHERIGVNKELLLEILDGLWFDYNWEQFDIQDPLFIAKTYIATLQDLKAGRCAADIKKYMISSLVDLFTYNENDFQGAFALLRKNYNKYIEQNNWLGALIEWSIYCVYRRAFSTAQVENTLPTLPSLKKLNAQVHVIRSMRDAYARAREYYTKVYLQEDTNKLVFVDDKGKRGELNFADKLAALKQIGLSYEPQRPRGKENVFVPQLYCIVQNVNSGEAPIFVEVPLRGDLLKLPKRPLTRAEEDKVFTKTGDANYFKQAKNDYVQGSHIQGKEKKTAEEGIDKKIATSAARSTELIHSERVLMELLRQPAYIKQMVDLLAKKLAPGNYIFHGFVVLGYSTNSICPQCTPTLISLMNSHQDGGFMRMAVNKLAAYEGAVNFMVPRSQETQDFDWTALRMNIFVTAKTNFDCEAHDLTQAGQHLHTKINKAPATSNPHAPLYVRNNEFILSDVPQLADGTPDQYQRFFFEFVGKDMHKDGAKTNDYAGVVFSSGSRPWH